MKKGSDENGIPWFGHFGKGVNSRVTKRVKEREVCRKSCNDGLD